MNYSASRGEVRGPQPGRAAHSDSALRMALPLREARRGPAPSPPSLPRPARPRGPRSTGHCSRCPHGEGGPTGALRKQGGGADEGPRNETHASSEKW